MQVGCCSGCLLAIICMVVFTYATSASLSSTDKDRPPEIKEDTSTVHTTSIKEEKSSAKVSFDKDALIFYAQEYAEKRLGRQEEIKWKGKVNVEKLRKSGNFTGDLYAVEQNFEVTNAYNVKIKHRARISMQFDPVKGYRGVWLVVDGKSL